jgi:hypothetical protein
MDKDEKIKQLQFNKKDDDGHDDDDENKDEEDSRKRRKVTGCLGLRTMSVRSLLRKDKTKNVLN